MNVYLAIHAFIALAVGFAMITSKQRVLWLTGFLLPLAGLGIYLGVRLSWPQILPFVLILVVLMRRRQGAFFHLPASGTLIALISLGLALSLWFFAFSEDVGRAMLQLRAEGVGIGQNELRYPVQIVSFATPWVMLVASYALVETGNDLKAALNGFVMGNLVSIGVGLYQSTAQGMGLPWLDDPELASTLHGNLGLGDYMQTFWVRGGISFARLSGLGGEPKHTAAFAVMAITLLVSQSLFSIRHVTKLWRLLLLLTGILFTMSTSSWIGLAAASLGIVIFSTYSGQSFSTSRPALRLVTIVGILSAFVFGISLLADSADREVIIAERFQVRLENLQSLAHFEPKDGALLSYLVDQPESVFLGFGPGGASFRLAPTGSQNLALAGAVTPTYTLTRVVSEVGLLGLILMSGMFFAWRKRLKDPAFTAAACFVTVQGIVILLQPMWVLPAYLFLVGAFLGNASWASRSRTAGPSAITP